MSDAERMLAALKSLPEFEGTVFRGAHEPPVAQTIGAPLPASRDPRIATDNFTAPIVVAILVRTARDLARVTRHPEDREVVLLPGVRLQVAARSAGGDLVVLEEIDGEEPARIDQVLAELTVTLDGARAAPPVALRAPGRFID